MAAIGCGMSPGNGGPPRWPVSVGTSSSCCASSSGITGVQVAAVSVKPWMRRSGSFTAHTLTVVVDQLDIRPRRVEHERAVVTRVVLGPLAWCAVVRLASGDSGRVELVHQLVGIRAEREVQPVRQRSPVVDQCEAGVALAEVHALRMRLRRPSLEAAVWSDRLVEPAVRVQISDPDPEVVDPPRLDSSREVHGLDTVPIRIEQEAAVVVVRVLALARLAVALVARVDAGAPKRVDLVARLRRERDVQSGRDRWGLGDR